jgi:acyl dehydratase
MPNIDVKDLDQYIGQETGVSDWLLIDQERVNKFADVTEDHQFIHVDPERAKDTQFGGPIAHGFLTLSLLPYFGYAGNGLKLNNLAVSINYGLNKVRFLTPVRVGKRIRARYKFLGYDEKRPGNILLRNEVTVEIEGEDKPALIAESLGMAVLK